MPTFVSHSSMDKAIYSTLCLALDAVSVDRWDTTKMLLGESLADQLKRAIDDKQLPAVLRGPNRNADAWSSVSLRDLLCFLERRSDDPAWQWLQSFAETWARAGGRPFPVQKRRSPNQKPWKSEVIDAAFRHFDDEGNPEHKAHVERYITTWAQERGHELGVEITFGPQPLEQERAGVVLLVGLREQSPPVLFTLHPARTRHGAMSRSRKPAEALGLRHLFQRIVGRGHEAVLLWGITHFRHLGSPLRDGAVR